MTNKIQAVIFDMDGVISDTLYHHTLSESHVLKNHGIEVSPKQLGEKYNAMPDNIMFEKIFNEHGKELNYPVIAEEKLNIFVNLLKKGLLPIPGSLKLIESLLKSNFKLAVASSSPATILDLVLSTLKIKNKFSTITSTEEVANGKPDPDIFLLAAKKLNIPPDNCLVIEDAERGVSAAKAANMKCVAITTTHSATELKNADMTIDSFDELTPAIIQSL